MTAVSVERSIEHQTKAMFRVYRIDYRGATISYPVKYEKATA